MGNNSWLGNPNGLFKLSESDKYVGSYISGEDIKSIFNVKDSDFKRIPLNKRRNAGYIDEKQLRRILKKENFLKANIPYSGRASLDEYIIAAIIRLCFSTAEVIQQYNWMGRKTADLFVSINNRIFVLEFLGPDHFVNIDKMYDDMKRKEEIEKAIPGSVCFLWPYWIQRCALNVRILFGDDKKSNGRGALWSSKCYFGDIKTNDAAQIIRELTAQFRAAPDGNYGYFYEGSNTDILHKPEHFIIKKILSGKQDYHLLIPPGIAPSEEDNWLPQSIINFKKMNI
jgi:hypothetical protein